MNQFINTIQGIPPFALVLLVAWGLAWKGWALWKSARRGENIWFIALLIINTFGLLEIFYIFVIARHDKEESPGERTQ